MQRKHEIDMTTGSIAPKIMKFTIPFMLSGILQTLFTAADNAVIGAFEGSNELAAVGSTGSITNFVINLFMGLAVGTNVVLARGIGSKQQKTCEETVHTAMLMSIIIGIFLGAVGFFFTDTFLTLLNCPEEVLSLASIYLKIYFLGMPAISAYNFASSILRSKGDTKRPLIYLAVAGVLNVVLNLILVIVFRLSTAGVAIATTVSQILSAYLSIRALTKEDGFCRLELKKLRIVPHRASLILKIGIPASIQGLMFSISNISIQSSVNTFGADAMAGVGAGANLNSIVWNTISAFGHASLAFTGQNYGAKKLDRIKKVYLWSILLMIACWIVVMVLILTNLELLLKVFLPDNEKALAFSKISSSTLTTTYVIAGLMEITVGMIRGLGYSSVPAVISVFGICGIRFVWLATVFQKWHTFKCLYVSYPTTWAITTVMLLVYFAVIYKKVVKTHN